MPHEEGGGGRSALIGSHPAIAHPPSHTALHILVSVIARPYISFEELGLYYYVALGLYA